MADKEMIQIIVYHSWFLEGLKAKCGGGDYKATIRFQGMKKKRRV